MSCILAFGYHSVVPVVYAENKGHFPTTVQPSRSLCFLGALLSFVLSLLFLSFRVQIGGQSYPVSEVMENEELRSKMTEEELGEYQRICQQLYSDQYDL